MSFDTCTVSVTSRGDAEWILLRPLVYEGARDTFIVPSGFTTDFATIPRILRWLVGRTGSHTRAVVLHDWLVSTGIDSGAVTHRDADALFRRVLRETGTPLLLRWLMWSGVRLGSLAGGRRDGWWRDAPAVLAITVAAAPLVVPPTMLAALASAVHFAAERVVELGERIWLRLFRRR